MYILIFVLMSSNLTRSPAVALSVEFNNYPACQAAAAALAKQAEDHADPVHVLVCAAKGEPAKEKK